MHLASHPLGVMQVSTWQLTHAACPSSLLTQEHSGCKKLVTLMHYTCDCDKMMHQRAGKTVESAWVKFCGWCGNPRAAQTTAMVYSDLLEGHKVQGIGTCI